VWYFTRKQVPRNPSPENRSPLARASYCQTDRWF
jgi:hypothetical protein